MTTQDINIIDILKRNSKLTHSDLAISEKEFAKYKNVLELLEKASEVSSELRIKLVIDISKFNFQKNLSIIYRGLLNA